MMVRSDHHGQEPAGPMASALGYQEKSVERHRFHMRVTSVLRSCVVWASLKMRSLLRFNHHQESSLISSDPLSDRLACRCIGYLSYYRGCPDRCGALAFL